MNKQTKITQLSCLKMVRLFDVKNPSSVLTFWYYLSQASSFENLVCKGFNFVGCKKEILELWYCTQQGQ